jgi:hypothetical protein
VKKVAIVAVCFAAATSIACAGAKVKIDDEASIDVGFRVQPLLIVTEKDTDGDGSFETDSDFKVRRGRLRLKGTITDRVGAFIQTDLGSGAGGAGYDWRVIDAWISLKMCDYCTIYAGENMAPASRQNLTSSGALMAIDRPGINYKTLTWGTRSVYAFANNTLGDADAGLRGDVDVRDNGATAFGATSLSDTLHLKYYAGVYDGIQQTEEDDLRLSGRVQVNFYDAEDAYFNLSSYLGGKKTIGIGASYDTQDNVALSEDKGNVDYSFYTLDAFADLPCGPGTITAEAAYEVLDLGGATALDHDGDAETDAINARQAEGEGFYAQIGYLVDGWQPWIGLERWDSTADDDKGSYDMFRAGVTYFIKGHNANIKAGYERLEADTMLASTTEDTINSFVMGCYVTY